MRPGFNSDYANDSNSVSNKHDNKLISTINKHRDQALIETLKYNVGNSNEAIRTRLQTNIQFYNLTEKSATTALTYQLWAYQ